MTARQRLAAKMPVAKAVGYMRVLWEVKTKVRLDESPVSLIYLATAMLGEVGKRPAVVDQPRAAGSGPIGTAVEQQRRRLTLDEMRSMTA